MKKGITILTMILTFTLNGQNLFFIGEKSFLSTENYSLKANSDKNYINDLDVKFAKDKNSKLIALSTKTLDVQFRGNLIIYLDDGTVITTSQVGIFDYVDKIALAVYYLTDEELDKMKKSNINTIRYSLKNEYGDDGTFGGNFTASNKSKIDFPDVISNFYK